MEIAGGVLGWSEEQFWSASVQYFRASLDGWAEKNGGKSDEINRQDYEEMKHEYAAELAMTDDDLARLRAKREQEKT